MKEFGVVRHSFRALVELYQEAEVVDPDPGVALLDAAPPGRLVHLLHGGNGDVGHGGVGQSKGHADPLQTEIIFLQLLHTKLSSPECFLQRLNPSKQLER